MLTQVKTRGVRWRNNAVRAGTGKKKKTCIGELAIEVEVREWLGVEEEEDRAPSEESWSSLPMLALLPEL